MRAPLMRRFGLRTSLDYTPIPTDVPLDEAAVRIRLATVKVMGCWAALESSKAQLDTCAGTNAGLAIAESSGIRGPTPLARPVLWGIGELRAAHRIGAWISADLHLGGGVAVIRDEYFATKPDGQEVRVRPTALGLFEVGAGLAVHAR